ncbi:MAG: FKBP-type peptidyl-prolyl cis-trans isomerase [Brumimicrobium sp.]
MKKIAVLFLAFTFIACNRSPENISEIDLDNFKERISFALGADMGSSLLNLPDHVFEQFNKNELSEGFYDFLTNKKDADDCLEILQSTISFETGDMDTTTYSANEISRCYGNLFGEMMRKNYESNEGISEIDPKIVKIGFIAALNGEDTIMPLNERQTMIMDFNNDLIKIKGQKFMDEKTASFIDNITDDGIIFIEEEPGNGENLNLQNEFNMIYVIVNQNGDTVISTYQNLDLTEEQNTQTISIDDGLFPQAWVLNSSNMEIGGRYTIHSDYTQGFGEDGLVSPNTQSYMIKPYESITIHTKVFSQGEKFGMIKENGKKIIEDAKKLPNTYTDPSGFILTTLEEGKGKQVPVGGDVQAHYILTNSSGDIVENSYMGAAQGMDAPTFSLNQVVEGWRLGIPKMKVGGRYILVLPYNLAYGERGNRGINPYETLTFEIEILRAGEPGSLTN